MIWRGTPFGLSLFINSPLFFILNKHELFEDVLFFSFFKNTSNCLVTKQFAHILWPTLSYFFIPDKELLWQAKPLNEEVYLYQKQSMLLTSLTFFNQHKVAMIMHCLKSQWTCLCMPWTEKMSFIRGMKHTLISFPISPVLPNLTSQSRPLVLFNYLRDNNVCTLPWHHKTTFVSSQLVCVCVFICVHVCVFC